MEQEAVTSVGTNDVASATLPTGTDEMVATLSQNITQFYGVFIDNLHKVDMIAENMFIRTMMEESRSLA